MGIDKQDRRVCKNCGIEFILTKAQKRQVREKWPVNCSRSCARKLQHKKNHKDKRENKKCLYCKSDFMVAQWNKDKVFCSIKCSSKHRFGRPKERIELTRKKIEQILKDKKYFKFIKAKARSLSYKYNIEEEDILQDFFLNLCEGRDGFIEQVAMTTIRKEFNRGISGKKYARDVIVQNDINAVNFIKKETSFFNSHELREYINDLKAVTSEYEFKVIILALKGFNRGDSCSLTYGSNEKFSNTWNKFCRKNTV